MITKKNLLAFGTVIVCCITVAWFSSSIQGVPKTYEVQPQIAVPEYKTDAAHAIDAYRHLMERYMDLNEKNSIEMGIDINYIMKKLDSIDVKLTKLSTRIARIENKLGIKQPKPVIKKEALPKSSKEKIHK